MRIGIVAAAIVLFAGCAQPPADDDALGIEAVLGEWYVEFDAAYQLPGQEAPTFINPAWEGSQVIQVPVGAISLGVDLAPVADGYWFLRLIGPDGSVLEAGDDSHPAPSVAVIDVAAPAAGEWRALAILAGTLPSGVVSPGGSLSSSWLLIVPEAR